MKSATFSLKKLYITVAILAIIALALLAPKQAVSQATVLDFEDLDPGTLVTTQYGARGVLFRFAFLDTDDEAHSGTRVLRAAYPGHEVDPGPFVIWFTSAQARVRLFAGGNPEPVDGTLRAFDSSGNLIAQNGPKPVTPNEFTTVFEVNVSTASIERVELEIGVTTFEAIDDLEFEGEPPIPVPTEPPVVQIIAPDNDAELDASTVTVQGTVTGDGLYGLTVFRIEHPLPPDSLAPPSIFFPASLTGSGATRDFSLPLLIGIGPHVITVEAENIGTLTGSDTVHFTNLPEPIRLRYTAEGGAPTFGELLYGGVEGGCTMAIYERGAISTEGGSTYVVLGSIFSKWFSLRDPGVPLSWVGCPTDEERDAPGGARAQDFVGGRIYAGLPSGAHYVPSVFVEAIDTLGGESATGVPIADPTDSIGVMQTWLFQQFTRPDRPDLLPSTLEIRGTPPTLWVERQAGDMDPLFYGEVWIHENSPTIWQDFPCSDKLGPCTVEPPSSPPPIENPGELYCQGTIYPFGPREWVAILGDYELTPILGIVADSHMAGEDNPLAHECYNRVEALDRWPSDFNIFIRPLHPYRNILGGANGEDGIIEMEVEWCWGRYFYTGWGEPHRGDLIFASGRWIIDCGHDSYNAEIHPPAVEAYMRTEYDSGWPATAARIWVNGVYTGDPVEFDIFPPPRPSPDAALNLVKPVDSQAAVYVNVEYSYPYFAPSHVHVRFTASPRQVEVERGTGPYYTGEMKWQSDRAYYGRWDVYWTTD